MLTQRIALAAAALFTLVPAIALAAPVTIPEPITPPIDGDGTGLCIASAVSTSPGNDFGNLNTGTYNSGMNAFMEDHKDDRVESVIRSVGSSRVDLQACKLEYSIVSPK